jgi:hypothetical protein
MRLPILWLVVAVQSASADPTQACGDKFLRVGRGARFQRGYVAVHPACVLIYANPRSAAAGELKELEPSLKRAGHKPAMVEDRAALTAALKTGHYNLVLTDLADVTAVQAEARSAPTKAEILPVLHQPTPAALAAAHKEYRCVAETPSRKSDVLAEIDDLMEQTQAAGAKPSPKPE